MYVMRHHLTIANSTKDGTQKTPDNDDNSNNNSNRIQLNSLNGYESMELIAITVHNQQCTTCIKKASNERKVPYKQQMPVTS